MNQVVLTPAQKALQKVSLRLNEEKTKSTKDKAARQRQGQV